MFRQGMWNEVCMWTFGKTYFPVIKRHKRQSLSFSSKLLCLHVTSGTLAAILKPWRSWYGRAERGKELESLLKHLTSELAYLGDAPPWHILIFNIIKCHYLNQPSYYFPPSLLSSLLCFSLSLPSFLPSCHLPKALWLIHRTIWEADYKSEYRIKLSAFLLPPKTWRLLLIAYF